MITCPKCGNELSDNETFCAKCGSRLSIKNICSNCGGEVNEGDKSCTHCGAIFISESESSETEDKKDLDITKKADDRKETKNSGNRFVFVSAAIIAAIAIIVIVIFLSKNYVESDPGDKEINQTENSENGDEVDPDDNSGLSTSGEETVREPEETEEGNEPAESGEETVREPEETEEGNEPAGSGEETVQKPGETEVNEKPAGSGEETVQRPEEPGADNEPAGSGEDIIQKPEKYEDNKNFEDEGGLIQL